VPEPASFLRLKVVPAFAEVLTARLEQAPTVQQRAKDVLRAARLPAASRRDPEVARGLKVAGGQSGPRRRPLDSSEPLP
jgi:hypothetical protein